MNPFGEVNDSAIHFSFLEEKHHTTPINCNLIYDEPNSICIQLSSSTQDDFSSLNSSKKSIDLKRKKNREAAKRSRQKKKQSILNLIKENKLLNAEIKAIRSEIERKLCDECKSQMNLQEINIEEENTLSHSSCVSVMKGPSLVFFTVLSLITMIGLLGNQFA